MTYPQPMNKQRQGIACIHFQYLTISAHADVGPHSLSLRMLDSFAMLSCRMKILKTGGIGKPYAFTICHFA